MKNQQTMTTTQTAIVFPSVAFHWGTQFLLARYCFDNVCVCVHACVLIMELMRDTCALSVDLAIYGLPRTTN